MTDTSSLSHLIDLLERCAGPDRELDASINLEVFSQIALPDAPQYTSSIDAAMALVPEGAGLRIDRYWTTTAQSAVWSALISTGGVPNNPRRVFEHYDGPNAAMAVSIAALKAHSVRDPGDSTKERALLLSKSPAEGGEM